MAPQDLNKTGGDNLDKAQANPESQEVVSSTPDTNGEQANSVVEAAVEAVEVRVEDAVLQEVRKFINQFSILSGEGEVQIPEETKKQIKLGLEASQRITENMNTFNELEAKIIYFQKGMGLLKEEIEEGDKKRKNPLTEKFGNFYHKMKQTKYFGWMLQEAEEITISINRDVMDELEQGGLEDLQAKYENFTRNIKPLYEQLINARKTIEGFIKDNENYLKQIASWKQTIDDSSILSNLNSIEQEIMTKNQMLSSDLEKMGTIISLYEANIVVLITAFPKRLDTLSKTLLSYRTSDLSKGIGDLASSTRKTLENALLVSQQVTNESAKELLEEMKKPLISDDVQRQLDNQTAQINDYMKQIEAFITNTPLLGGTSLRDNLLEKK